MRDADLLPRVHEAAELMLRAYPDHLAPLAMRWTGAGERSRVSLDAQSGVAAGDANCGEVIDTGSDEIERACIKKSLME